MTIVLDAMGSDNHPGPEVEGAVEAARLFKEEIVLVGPEDVLEPLLAEHDTAGLPIRIHHAPDVIEMSDKVVETSRKKPLNSMAVGCDLVKSGEGDAFVTAGSTGAAMFNGLRKLGRIKGVQRPALTSLIPTKTGFCVVLDIGANADCRPEFLQQFAVLGSIFAEKVLEIQNPRVGLLSNGEEPGKGNQLVKDTFNLLSETNLNFIGNVEPKEIYAGHSDVVVTDGFTGNVFLKASESVASFLVSLLREGLTSSVQTKVGALLAKPAFNTLKAKMDPSEFGAAPLLGIDGLVFVGHGRSDGHAITNAIRQAHDAIKIELLDASRQAIQDRLAQINIETE
jgi:glycerol-3-phosphate acyltransferase PlsX